MTLEEIKLVDIGWWNSAFDHQQFLLPVPQLSRTIVMGIQNYIGYNILKYRLYRNLARIRVETDNEMEEQGKVLDISGLLDTKPGKGDDSRLNTQLPKLWELWKPIHLKDKAQR